jgi:peroxiredoxin (alkyl hydroperoxide reductase subunit C)
VTAISDRIEEFADLNAEVLGVSHDSVFVHRAWINTPREKNGVGKVAFPLGSDPTGRVSRDYGVLLEEEGLSLRGLFIVDPRGVLQYEVVHNLNIGRSVDETLRELEALQSGNLCPADWKPGGRSLGKAA